ncbi:MAG: CPBP family intramembrane metalloprotease [Woeseiaceae bacterium]|nr:CPBP family intramembrane metalloprotease [Woeseiaceae bacterium]
MDRKYWPALTGMIAAIAITTAMDATGYTMFSALPLFPLALLFWYLQGFSRVAIGLSWGRSRDFGWAIAYPCVVLGALGAIAWLAGAIDTSETAWNTTLLNIAASSTIGIVMVLITEEGFFRGWLWASLERAGCSRWQVVGYTTLAFTVWHVSPISLDTGYDLPAAEIPVYLVNATLLGLIWGMLRMVSGSVVVPSVCHAVWNAIDYPLFGFGEHAGALGIEQTHVYGPEVGALGIVANGAFAILLWRRYAHRSATQ